MNYFMYISHQKDCYSKICRASRGKYYILVAALYLRIMANTQACVKIAFCEVMQRKAKSSDKGKITSTYNIGSLVSRSGSVNIRLILGKKTIGADWKTRRMRQYKKKESFAKEDCALESKEPIISDTLEHHPIQGHTHQFQASYSFSWKLCIELIK